MTQLDCSVTSCLYNQDHYCAKEDITVGGSNAKKASDTCCESFKERSGAPSNSKCCADSVGIGGGADACQCQDTECGDFCCK